jgi:16S rRNA (uracil1498-N3)-methyltransferase
LASLVRTAENPRRIVLAIGPEGGFAPEEEEILKKAGFLPAALSPQILRGETAALAAVAIAAHSIDF